MSFNVAIDGPAGAGKSTVAKSAACGQIDISLRYQEGVQQVILNGENVSGLIRTEEVGNMASATSVYKKVREKLVELQKDLAKKADVIMDGRDIGTCVLPDADVKIFLSASPEVRARRRWLELQEKGAPDTYEAVLADLIARDERDSNRAIAPLRPANDAVLLDTSGMTLQESIDAILKLIRKKVTV